MAAGDVWQVCNCSVLAVSAGAGTEFDTVCYLLAGDKVKEISQKVNDRGTTWIEHDNGGWNSTGYLKLIEDAEGNKIDDTEVTEIDSDEESAEEGEEGEGEEETPINGYLPEFETLIEGGGNSVLEGSDFAKIKHISGVFGLPYQFLPNTDNRITGVYGTKGVSDIGYEYAEKIVEHMPLMFIQPGKPNFLSKYDEETKENVLKQITDFYHGITEDNNVSDLLDSTGRYYTFEYDLPRYYTFVNPMCRIAARYLNIQDVELNGVKLDRYNWQDSTQIGVSSIADFGNFNAIPFYVDSETSISESFSNSTTQSMIASGVNSISDYSRELQFLLGYGAANGASILEDVDVAKNMQNVQNTIESMLGNGGDFLKNLASHLTTVASGGKIIFPEIWADSSFARSYTCDFKFVAPDPSNLSIYLNVLVPLFHLIGLVAPQSVDMNPNGYTNPFLVRAIYKGFFNVDMGIITSMSVTKGAECQWTPEGIPTSIIVSIEIKDLYSAMSITPTSLENFKYDTVSNTALMDYIANLCGINIYKPEIKRTLDIWYMNNIYNRVADIPVDIWGGITTKIQNLIMSIYR